MKGSNIGESREHPRRLTIFFPGSVEIAGLLESASAIVFACGLRGNERIVPGFPAALHGLQSKPCKRILHSASRSPLMWPFERPQEMRVSQPFQFIVRDHKFGIVEIESH